MTSPTARQIVAVKPIPVPVAGREVELEVKVTAPASGGLLPVIVFSHGNAWSFDGYAPLVDRWAAAGFIVVQPTHLDWRRYGIGFDDPRFAGIWRMRIADMEAVLNGLDDILADAGPITARPDRDRIAVVGHSWGAQTAGTLLGARVAAADGSAEAFAHPAVAAGVLIGATGTGESLTAFAREHLPFMRPGYSTMAVPTLVIAGGEDRSALSTRGYDWFTDAYHLSPAPKRLLTITAAEHTFGGIAGESVAETTDEDPDRVAFVADAVAAYLLDVLGADADDWTALVAQAATTAAYDVESK